MVVNISECMEEIWAIQFVQVNFRNPFVAIKNALIFLKITLVSIVTYTHIRRPRGEMKIKPIVLFTPKSCFHLFPNKSHPICILITVFTFEIESKLIGCLSILCNDIVYWSYDPAHRRWLHKTCTLHV